MAAVGWENISAVLRLNGLFQKNSNARSERGLRIGHEISRGIEERSCGNSWGQLKKKWNFQGKGNFHGSWFLTLEFPRGVKEFCKISSKGEACYFLSGISNSLSLLETLDPYHEFFQLYFAVWDF